MDKARDMLLYSLKASSPPEALFVSVGISGSFRRVVGVHHLYWSLVTTQLTSAGSIFLAGII